MIFASSAYLVEIKDRLPTPLQTVPTTKPCWDCLTLIFTVSDALEGANLSRQVNAMLGAPQKTDAKIYVGFD